MKNRQLFSFLVVAVLAVFTFSGCEDVAQVQTPVTFAQLRVANFNNHCEGGIAYDVYVFPTGQPSELPAVRGGLSYGMVSPWIDNLPTNRDAGMSYTVQVRPAGGTANSLETTIVLKPGDRQTLWIFKSDGTTLNHKFISDDPADDNQTVELTKAYFRFLNTEETQLTLVVGDPLNGKPLAAKSNVGYQEYTSYEGFTSTTVDTTLTFFVVDGNANVVGRLAGVALEGGTFKTVTWGGNCLGKYIPQEDPTVQRPDSHRVRILNDAGDGGDETKVPPQTMRYFFVNALIPPAKDSLKNIFGYDQMGVVVNNDNRYNFGPLVPYSVGPNPVSMAEGVYNVIPTATLLTDAVNFKGYVFNSAAPKSGMLLFDFRAGPRSEIKTDQLVAVVLSDTVRVNYKPGLAHTLDSGKGGQFVFRIPDQPNKDAATVVIANMLVNKIPLSANNKFEFFINDQQVDRGPGNWSRKLSHTMTIPPGETNLKVRINESDNEIYTHPAFRAEAGGIYFIVVVGRRLSQTPQDNPRIMVIRTNPVYP